MTFPKPTPPLPWFRCFLICTLFVSLGMPLALLIVTLLLRHIHPR